jgi:type VI secretion system secreted protein VgrG
MDVKATGVHGAGPEWYDFPGEYATPGDGARKARLVAEAFDRAAACMQGRSSCGRLYPGAVFRLADAPIGFADGEYVVRSVEHAWKHEDSGFVCSFDADPKELTYRPPRNTFVPTILNPLTGVVCTNGEDIQCDAFGRVKIHFPWDRIRPFDDNCSDWVPVIQDNTGGSSAIPRKDWEMVVHFLEGDPDRPVVVGRVYNGEDPPPEDLPEMRDRSKLVSRQSPSREDANMLRFEDRAGHEAIRAMAPMFQNIRVANNQSSQVGRSNTLNIGNDETVSIGADAEWQVGATSEPSVQNNQTYTVKGNRKHKVGGGDSNAVGGDHTLDVGVNHEQEVFCDIAYGSTSLDEIIKADVLETYKTRYETMIGGPMTVTIKGSLSETALNGKSEQNTRDRSETIGAGHTVKSDTEVQVRADKNRKVKVGASFTAQCSELMTLTGASSFTSCSKSASYTATADLMLIVSDGPAGQPGTNESWIVLRDGVLEIKAMDKVVFDVSGSSSSQSSSSSQI